MNNKISRQKKQDEAIKKIFEKQNIECTIYKDFIKVFPNNNYLILKNIIFITNKDIVFDCPKDTILIIDNCSFTRNVYISNGNIELINPSLTNINDSWIDIDNAINTKLTLTKNLRTKYIITSNKITINANNKRIKGLYTDNVLEDIEEVELNNISNIKKMHITGKNIYINNSNITSDNKIEIHGDKITLNNSTINNKDQEHNIIEKEKVIDNNKKTNTLAKKLNRKKENDYHRRNNNE